MATTPESMESPAGVLAGALLLPMRDACVLLLSWLAIFAFARGFFTWWLFRDYEVNRATGAQLLFSLSFMFSFSIFEMVLFELMGVMHVASRQWVWRVDLIAMTYLIVLVLPLTLFYTAAREYGLARRRAIVTSLLVFSVYLYSFWRLGAVLEEDLPRTSVEGENMCILTYRFEGVYTDSNAVCV